MESSGRSVAHLGLVSRRPTSALRWLGLAACAALLAAGCSDAPEPTGTVVVQQSGSGSDTIPVPPEVSTFRITAHAADDATVYGPRDVARAAQVVLEHVPVGAVTLQIDYLAGSASQRDAVPIATFTTSINLEAGTVVTIVDPRLVDLRDPIESSFVTFGCNRLAQAQVSPSVPSSANVGQLVKDFAEIATPGKLEPEPRRVFFIGDLVTNLQPGTATLESQLAGWKELYASTPLARSPIDLIATTGNHELLMQVTAPDPSQSDEATESLQVPNPPTGEVFSALMADFIPAANGPTQAPPNLDHVERDESRLSFSFRDGSTLFVAVDTDTYEGGDQPSDTGLVPLVWLQEMISAANADPTIRDVLVLGHRPIDSPDPQNLPISPVDALPFYQILAAPGPGGQPTKVRGYFAAHAHLWNQGVPMTAPAGSTLRQVIVGNGGSTVAAVFNPPIGYYGYTFVGVTRAGAVVVKSFGRPIPTPYDSSDPQPESILRENLTLSPIP